jgi:hypothetical protein
MMTDYLPVRGVFNKELIFFGYYYNTIAVNIFRKILFFVVYFAVLLPLSLVLRKLYGDDS